ncbi:MAG: ubiquinol-cytochrome c reductase iron-sulfur subunit [Actinomycetota bacterium]|nr:ubiquinol-cytochrome c reductase iron-sulfur subunit [Actinomycetota bacterium]
MADRHEEGKSPTTADRGIPGAFEGETVSRRRFMVGSVHAVGGIAAAGFALPAIGFALGPILHRSRISWKDVGAASDFPMDTYVPRVFSQDPNAGEAGKTTIYVRKHNPYIDQPPKDQYDNYVALSTKCMHLGCPIAFYESSQKFVCPCHGGSYDFAGKRDGGPPVRPLDRFYTQVQNGRLMIGPRYSVNSELRRFSPRDPAQPLDGIGQYLYPKRLSTPDRPKGAKN